MEKHKREDKIIDQVINTWKVHNNINLYLLSEIPKKGLEAVPARSKGRNVASQFLHMNRVRLGWLHYHTTGKRPRLSAGGKMAYPVRKELIKSFRVSGAAVEAFIGKALCGEAKTRAFSTGAIRWMGYLISHESHHRGQIVLALKQNGMRLHENVSLHGLWGKWIWGH